MYIHLLPPKLIVDNKDISSTLIKFKIGVEFFVKYLNTFFMDPFSIGNVENLNLLCSYRLTHSIC